MKNPITSLVESIDSNSTSKEIQKIKIDSIETVKDLLATITDPEIPVLNIVELGILRNVELINEQYVVTITPTYTGCPAMGMIEAQIKQVLDLQQINYKIVTSLESIWTTEWMTEEAKMKLKNYGIAPPLIQKRIQKLFEDQGIIPCPLCDSKNTKLISEFSSTACKSMYKCHDCLEPFDYFKCH